MIDTTTTTTEISLIDDIWTLIVRHLSPTVHYTTLLALLSTHRKAYLWICGNSNDCWHATIQQINATPMWRRPTGSDPKSSSLPPSTSLLTNVRTRLEKLTCSTSLMDTTDFLLGLMTAAPQQCEPLGSNQSYETVSCTLRVLRLAIAGTQALYEAHDQECGFSSNSTFVPLTHCGNMDWISVGELYIYIEPTDVACNNNNNNHFDAHNGKGYFVNVMNSVMAPTFKSRCAFVDYHKQNTIEAWERDALIKNSFAVTGVGPGTAVQPVEIETRRDHSIHSLCINGYPLMHNEYKEFRRKLYVYSGRPALFPLALWLNKHRDSLLGRLARDMKCVTDQYRVTYVTGLSETNVPCIVQRFIYKKSSLPASNAPSKTPIIHQYSSII